jgi:hypothetical protein
MNSPE